MKKWIILTVAIAAVFSFKWLLNAESTTAQLADRQAGVTITLSGHLNGTFSRNDVAWSRIENPLLNAEATIGFFTDPPSMAAPFDIAMVLGNIVPGAALVKGTYAVIPVFNDVPALIPGTRGGFMTIVPTGQSVPREEFFTRAGSFTVDSVSSSVIFGSIDVVLANADSSKTISVIGEFYQPLN
jgi:hypothetical protein